MRTRPPSINPLAYLATLAMERKTIPRIRMMNPKIRRNIIVRFRM